MLGSSFDRVIRRPTSAQSSSGSSVHADRHAYGGDRYGGAADRYAGGYGGGYADRYAAGGYAAGQQWAMAPMDESEAKWQPAPRPPPSFGWSPQDNSTFGGNNTFGGNTTFGANNLTFGAAYGNNTAYGNNAAFGNTINATYNIGSTAYSNLPTLNNVGNYAANHAGNHSGNHAGNYAGNHNVAMSHQQYPQCQAQYHHVARWQTSEVDARLQWGDAASSTSNSPSIDVSLASSTDCSPAVSLLPQPACGPPVVTKKKYFALDRISAAHNLPADPLSLLAPLLPLPLAIIIHTASSTHAIALTPDSIKRLSLAYTHVSPTDIPPESAVVMLKELTVRDSDELFKLQKEMKRLNSKRRL